MSWNPYRRKDGNRTPLSEDRPATPCPSEPAYALRLYIAGPSQKSALAFSNLKKICDEHLEGRYEIELVDLLQNSQLGRDDQIMAVPTLVRRLPGPIRKISGDLSNTERVLAALDLRPPMPAVCH
jgi:circadian clock protein KaiB